MNSTAENRRCCEKKNADEYLEYMAVSPEEMRYRFGKADVETLAMALYYAFHGECRCTSHPFQGAGDAWRAYRNEDDTVVDAFRLAALDAYTSLKMSGVGSLE